MARGSPAACPAFIPSPGAGLPSAFGGICFFSQQTQAASHLQPPVEAQHHEEPPRAEGGLKP